MKLIRMTAPVLALLLPVLLFVRCAQPKGQDSPAEYDLSKPLTYPLEDKLKEISGICFRPGDDQVIFAIEDEHARMFRISTEGRILSVADFGKKGDYEDVAITGSSSYVLRSDGVIFSSVIATGDESIESKAAENLVPSGEYEGLMAESDSTLILLCKNCKIKKDKGLVSAYKVTIHDSILKPAAEPLKFDISSLDASLTDRKISASCIAKNPITGQWFIVSSVNKLLIIFDPNMKAPLAYLLDPKIFPQPEGICFDTQGNMFISNEAVTGRATLLRFNRANGK